MKKTPIKTRNKHDPRVHTLLHRIDRKRKDLNNSIQQLQETSDMCVSDMDELQDLANEALNLVSDCYKGQHAVVRITARRLRSGRGTVR
jgi:hypothetical protein